MLSFNPAFSPLKIFNRGMAMLATDGLKLILSSTICLTLPYILLNYWLLKPFYDGTLRVHSRLDPDYIWRMGTFYFIYFCTRGLNYTITGQLLFNQGLGQQQSLNQLIPAALVKLGRAIWIYLPVIALAQIGYSVFVLPGLLLGYIIDFTLPNFMLERKELGLSWREGLGYLRGQLAATLCNFTLMCVVSLGIQKGMKWAVPVAFVYDHFLMFAVLSGIMSAVVELFLQAWMTSLYFTARNISHTTPEGIAQVFD